jgi:hypothetical protein
MNGHSPFDLFAPTASTDRLHPQFTELCGSALHRKARDFMNAVLGRMGDPNGNFLRDFQKDGFHSRVFELACFAYLEEAGLAIHRQYESPDYLVSAGAFSAAIEAVTANPPTGQATDLSLRQMVPLSEDEILDKVAAEVPRRIANSLLKKLGKGYQNLPHCHGKPLVFMIAPYFEPGAGFYSDDAIAYPLFGAPEGFPEAVAPFFEREDAAAVSAVLYCNQFTVSRFLRLTTDWSEVPNSRAFRDGVCYRRHGKDGHVRMPFRHLLGSPHAPKESWAEGVTVFENPFARYPLPPGFLPCTSRIYEEDGFVCRDVGDFHPVVSFMQIHSGNDTEDETETETGA